ncbi:MAG: hypothetical protein OXN44_08085 [Acidimicrobiaceae bacterium]|nr:hypothetical protein [Acidimicrobiaceae bacterium]MDE0607610.1 hypothetical protein [Acidimicrobiaceae bacterium]
MSRDQGQLQTAAKILLRPVFAALWRITAVDAAALVDRGAEIACTGELASGGLILPRCKPLVGD